VNCPIDDNINYSCLRTTYGNYDVSEIVNETNENLVVRMLFLQANLTSVHNYGPIGDPKVSEGEKRNENVKY
jgi:hypothetical protein